MITSFFKRAGSSTSKSSDERNTNQEETLQFDGADPASNEFGSVFLNMPIEEKRKLYHCEKYLNIEDLSTWPVHYKVRKPAIVRRIQQQSHKRDSTGGSWQNRKVSDAVSSVSDDINSKISLWQGDITRLEIDGIVNAANKSLMGGGGVDGSIHRAAGRSLKQECAALHGCDTGDAKITSGHELPARYVLHTVGPMGANAEKLRNCYQNCLSLVLKYNLRSVAFCCISTGVYGYPNRAAAEVALHTTRRWLQDHHSEVDRVIFCTFLDVDSDIYEELMAEKYFPIEKDLFHAPAVAEAPDSPREVDDDLVVVLELAPSPPTFEPRDDWDDEEWEEDDANDVTAMSQDQPNYNSAMSQGQPIDNTAMSQDRPIDNTATSQDRSIDNTATSQDLESHCIEDDVEVAMSQDLNVVEVTTGDDDDEDVDDGTLNTCSEGVNKDSHSADPVEISQGIEPTNSPAEAKRSKSEEN